MSISQNDTASRLAEIIEAHRKALHITRAMVAERSGLSPSTITRIAQGYFAKPSPDSLRAIAIAIEIPYEELFAAAGWVPGQMERRNPHVHISYHNLSEDVIQEIEVAVDAVAARYGRCFRPECGMRCRHRTIQPPDNFIAE